MLTASVIKNIKSLKEKNERVAQGLFIAEGEKLIEELLHSDFIIESIYANTDWLNNIDEKRKQKFAKKIVQVSEKELSRISLLKQPNKVLALVKIPGEKIKIEEILGKTILAFDNISDPGNLGSAIRIADWFGIKNIICSINSVDAYNPKVVQATMGSVFRIRISYVELEAFFMEAKSKTNTKIYATTLAGQSIYQTPKQNNAILLFGNESHGISNQLLKMCDAQIKIPAYSSGEKKFISAESLNIAMAAAIICAEWKREER